MMRFATVFLFTLALAAGDAWAECMLGSTGEMRPVGHVIYNIDHDVMQACRADGEWYATHGFIPATGPLGCSDPGDICSDGTIYAGQSPDGGGRMYTTPANTGDFTWNNGSTNYVATGLGYCYSAAEDCVTGRANTAHLAGLSGAGSPAPYRAAEACAGLEGAAGHGHSDWYLPAWGEMAVLCAHRDQGALAGSFSNPYYWTSTEVGANAALYLNCDGTTSSGSGMKHFNNRVRCVRRAGS